MINFTFIPSHRRLCATIGLSLLLHGLVMMLYWKPRQPTSVRRVTRVVRLFKIPRSVRRFQPRSTAQTLAMKRRVVEAPKIPTPRTKPRLRSKQTKIRPTKKRREQRRYRRKKRSVVTSPSKKPVRIVRTEPRRTPPVKLEPPSGGSSLPGSKKAVPSYKGLDLRPQPSLTTLSKSTGNTGNTPQGRGHRPGRGQGQGKGAWVGNDSFGRTMRKYHRDWKEWHRHYSGLTDAFFGTAQLTIDRCLETSIVDYLQKHLNYGEIAQIWLGPKWKGHFVLTWDEKGRGRVDLRKSWGYHKLNPVVMQWAQQCLVRIKIPKRLQGKKLWVLAETQIFAKVRMDLGKIIGVEEYRDPQTGSLRWKPVAIGTVQIWANTVYLRQRILP